MLCREPPYAWFSPLRLVLALDFEGQKPQNPEEDYVYEFYNSKVGIDPMDSHLYRKDRIGTFFGGMVIDHSESVQILPSFPSAGQRFLAHFGAPPLFSNFLKMKKPCKYFFYKALTNEADGARTHNLRIDSPNSQFISPYLPVG